MTTVAALTRAELGARLAGAGIDLVIGSFVVHLQTPIADVADGIALLYADYPLLDAAPFADFRVRLAPSGGVRRWYKPEAHFLLDGAISFKPLPLDHALPMFEWGLNFAISSNAHSFVMIHAAVVANAAGDAAILPAPPGSGKSTLCAALVHRGWRLLSDELALLRLSDGLLIPMARPISLKNASIDVIRGYIDGAALSRPVTDTAKGTVALLRAPADSVAAALTPARPAWVIFPKYTPGADATLTPMSRARACVGLAENSFNYSLLGAQGFDVLTRAVAGMDGYQFSYSRLDDAVATFAALPPPSR